MDWFESAKALWLVFFLIVSLALYEVLRGVLAFRKGKKWTLATKDFIAAAVIGIVVVMILYVKHEYFFN